ncbi:hypothetical protein D3C80_2050290 [compost metagenome]
MELNMIVNIARARLHGADKRQLFVVHVFNQVRKIGIAVCGPGARQIRRVTVVLCTRIQQETAYFRRRAVIQFGVV